MYGLHLRLEVRSPKVGAETKGTRLGSGMRVAESSEWGTAGVERWVLLGIHLRRALLPDVVM